MLITDLNDDCLDQILKELSLYDQVTIKMLSCRFDEIIKSIWHQQSKKVAIEKDEFNKFQNDKQNENLVEYLSLIGKSVEYLNLEGIHFNQFNSLGYFPNVKKLNCSLQSYSRKKADKLMLIMLQKFPALENLTYQSSLTGKYLHLFTNLTELNIDNSQFLKEAYFKRIFKSLKLRRLSLMSCKYVEFYGARIRGILSCKTLEELRIDDNHLMHLLYDISGDLPNLRKLTYFSSEYEAYVLKKISNIYGSRIQKAIYHSTFRTEVYHLESLGNMKNLQTIIIIDSDFKDIDFGAVTANLTNLREFRFLKSSLDDMDNSILSLIHNCPLLEVLDISESRVVTQELLYCLIAVIQNTKRKTSLKFYCYGTEIVNNYSTETILPQNLNICLQKQILEFPPPNTCYFEWE